MCACSTFAFLLVLIVPSASAEAPDAPAGDPPHLWLASASEQDGKVVIRIAIPQEQAGSGATTLGNGVRTQPAATIVKWSNLKARLILGETVQALCVDGGIANSKTVLKNLTKPKGAAVFIRKKEGDPSRPAAFYLAFFREDTLILIVNEEAIYPRQP
jgi:hypothetical protein